jgi:enamine deaminase RidA (YjgF/YER057c/UK114 family)
VLPLKCCPDTRRRKQKNDLPGRREAGRLLEPRDSGRRRPVHLGIGGEDGAGNIPADFEAEVRQSLDNIGSVLKKAEISRSDVVSVQVYLTNAATFERMNEVYMNYFKDPRPTRTTVVVAKLVGLGQIEITATARK